MEKYDVIIVGSGLGGLECGVILGREGYKVLILEKNKQIGGNLQIFARNKRIFDTGVHYIGGLGKGENLYKYFKYLGIMDDLKIQPLDKDGFDVVSFADDPMEYKYAQGYKNFIETMAGYFPEEREGIEKYCDAIREVCRAFPMYMVEMPQDSMDNMKYLGMNARDHIATFTKNEKLRKILAGTNGLYAGEGDRTPFYMHALVLNSYIESSWRCIDGGAQIGRLLANRIKENGGKIINHAEAKRFIFNDNLIEAVELTDGRKFEAKQFISNIHPSLTLNMVEEGKLRKAYTKRIHSLENSLSTFIVYIVLKKDTIPYFNHNHYYFIDPDVWQGGNYGDTWPPSLAIFTSANSKGSEYADLMIAMAYMRYDETKQWEETYNTVAKSSPRGQEYEKFKEEKAEQLLDTLEQKYPGIRENIECYYTSTPLTYRDYIGTVDGSIYGISKDYKDPLRSFISARTKVPNLLLTGQNLNMHGILGVTISAITTCGEMLGKAYLMEKVIRANKTELCEKDC